MFVLFALLAAVGWGSSDFAAGSASRRNSAVSVVILTHLASFVALFAISLVPGQLGSPAAADMIWGLAAGAAGGAGAMLLFRGLGKGSMSVVAPVTATGAALVPVAVGLAQGDSLGPFGLVGVVLAIGAIILVSLAAGDGDDDASEAADPVVVATADGQPGGDGFVRRNAQLVAAGAALPPPVPGTVVSLAPPPPPIPPWLQQESGAGGVQTLTPTVAPAPSSPATATPGRSLLDVLRQPGMVDALLSGLGFGLFFVLIAQTSETAGHWPLVTARFVSAALFAAIAIMTFTPVFPDRRSQPSVVLAGVLDAAAAVFFVLSTRSGLLSVGAVLASLYPAATVLLARFIAQERITRTQVGGLVLAGLAVSLLAV